MDFKQEYIKAFAIKCKIKELRRIIHELACARIIVENIYNYDAHQLEKTLKEKV